MKQYITYMYKCLELAIKAQGKTSPNPLVGCVVVDKNGNIISTGYHEKYGENHAERNALLKLDNAKDCTLYVNLEPCSHYGKTPPCADLIIEKGVKKVVYGMQDVNPIVAGNGLAKLKDAGIEVVGPILEDECKKLNEIFIKNQLEHKTFVAIKTATTIDGKIATYNGDSKWITASKSRDEVKNIRAKYDAILTSSSTVIADNPTMLHKKKIILDRELKTNFKSNIYQQNNCIVFYDEKFNSPSVVGIDFIKTPVINEKLDIEFILSWLYKNKIMSVLVEAGGKMNGSFLPYADKIYHFVAPKILNDNSGRSCFDGDKIDKISKCIEFKLDETQMFDSDILLIYTKE